MDEIRSLLKIPAKDRAERLGQWFSAQPDPDLAAQLLARALSEMEQAPYRASRSHDTELIYFLDAERLRFTLDEAAERCSQPTLASKLWTHAAVSAMFTLESADLPYIYATRAVRANPESDAAWEVFTDALRYYPSDFLYWNLSDFHTETVNGSLTAEFLRRAWAAARSVAKDWEEADRARLAELEGKLG